VILPGTTIRHRVVTGSALATQAPNARARRVPAATPSGASTQGAEAAGADAPVYARVKPVLEAVVAAVALVLLSPVLAVLALLVRLDSRGPVLYGAPREGKDGRVFKCLKFRSMYVGADLRQQELAAANGVDGPQFKMDKDPRVTRVGRWIRGLNVDELPQLINVVRGDMSFVGPRPSPFRENRICVPWRQARLSVRPGITGLWQICRHDRSNGDFHQWIEYDLLYVRHFSWRVDARILLATIRTLGGRTPVPVASIVPVAGEVGPGPAGPGPSAMRSSRSVA
jgi:lipopolysaccharide/colanic/teichoic acid biosynthesis glycosyltransferase